jgi:hypothetical protein
MTDFRLWGRIESIGPSDFVAIATAVPEDGDPVEVHTLAETHASQEAATKALETLMVKVSGIVRKSGGTITRVDTGGL